MDDELGADVIVWADQREQPTLLVRCDPRVGLTDEHVDQFLAFAKHLSAPRDPAQAYGGDISDFGTPADNE